MNFSLPSSPTLIPPVSARQFSKSGSSHGMSTFNAPGGRSSQHNPPVDMAPSTDEAKMSGASDKSPTTVGGSDKASSSKKPRHRHSPAQLAALNELFDQNEHPSLEDRTELAERLGMETKTVNAWFQNKRASTKKRNRAPANSAQPLQPVPDSNSDAGSGHTPYSAEPLSASSSNLPSIANLLNDSSVPPRHSKELSLGSHPHTSRRQKARNLDAPYIDADRALVHKDLPVTEHARGVQGAFFAGPTGNYPLGDRFVSENAYLEHRTSPHFSHMEASISPRYSPDEDTRFVSENDGLGDKKPRGEHSRTRTLPEQAEELRKAYAANPHPSREERELLAEKTGLRYQSITNWFQNQRSQAKIRRHKDTPLESTTVPYDPMDAQDMPRNDRAADAHANSFATLPPAASHPSLYPTSARNYPLSNLPPLPRPVPRRAGEVFSPMRHGIDPRGERRSSLPPPLHPPPTSPRSRRSITPYCRDFLAEDGRRHHRNGSTDDVRSRSRRSRPEPRQLEALKRLWYITNNPSLEERSAVALECGINLLNDPRDVVRVSNWFRNVRQTVRKRVMRRNDSHIRGVRSPYPRAGSSESSSLYGEDDSIEFDASLDMDVDERSDDDFPEAVTPSSGLSASPPPFKRGRGYTPWSFASGIDNLAHESMGMGIIEPAAYTELAKAVGIPDVGASSDLSVNVPKLKGATTFSGVRIEDALLLLSFHQHATH
ncbi:hypothetical protein CONPUDRAFT_69445 [Coniophora puteana RWD-64-598 SS2]|uniref:Homeobox domain-containing protein n=1 Tax=Coniophora puteana (strain RWD-64-598) TaxID=741705 RepID=A0A5M3N6T2_CONPW|nr:uncharacterized protein CONPUDRAFT_69445 [Coniophora puteana RWD-64-598 SS2]EIW87142.1 hypothetical protein CONPUDRAFT_69445 [Coniophora puteana RWD-64-598 SS2]